MSSLLLHRTRLAVHGVPSEFPKLRVITKPAPFDWFAFVLNHLGYRGEGR